MKLGYWTVGMPAWTAGQLAAKAVEYGFDGVEINSSRRLPAREGFELPLDPTDAEVAELRSAFASRGVELLTLLAANHPIHVEGRPDWGRFEDDFARHVALAARVGARRVRVGISGIDEPPDPAEWDDTLDRAWAAIGRSLDPHDGIQAVIENHPKSADARRLFGAAERHDDARIGLMYSPEHAMVMQEDFLGLVDRYAPWIFEICLADRRVIQEGLADWDTRYYTVRYEACVIGEGNLPIAQLIRRLAAAGFDDYVSLKWEKSPRYHQHLPEGESVMADYVALLTSIPEFRTQPIRKERSQ